MDKSMEDSNWMQFVVLWVNVYIYIEEAQAYLHVWDRVIVCAKTNTIRY